MKPRKVNRPAPYTPVAKPRRLQRGHLTLEEYRDLLAAAKARGAFEHVVIRLLYEHGLRAAEVGKLRLDHTSLLRDGRLYIPRGKGSKTEWVRTSFEMVALLEDWIARTYPHETHRKPAAFVFPSVHPRLHGVGRTCGVSRWMIYVLVKDLATEVGLDTSIVTPHALKRSRAQHMFEAAQETQMSLDEMLKGVAEVLGHTAASTSWRYYVEATGRARELGAQVLQKATGDR